MKKLLSAALLGATGALTTGASAATTYNFADFDNPVFKYGFGVTGFTFTSYSVRFENASELPASAARASMLRDSRSSA